jgi:hypothetical protein
MAVLMSLSKFSPVSSGFSEFLLFSIGWISSLLAACITAQAKRDGYFSLRWIEAPLSHIRISRNYRDFSAIRPAMDKALDGSNPSLSKRTPLARSKFTIWVGRESEMLISSQWNTWCIRILSHSTTSSGVGAGT